MNDSIEIDIPHALQEHWKKNPIVERDGEKLYSSNHVINAYLSGELKGQQFAHEQIRQEQEAQIQVELEKIDNNIKSTISIAEDILVRIANKNFKCYDVFMKIKNIVNYDLIFRVSEENFISDEFTQVYSYARELRKQKQNNTFYVNLSFMPAACSFNEQKLISDGYHLKRHVSN